MSLRSVSSASIASSSSAGSRGGSSKSEEGGDESERYMELTAEDIDALRDPEMLRFLQENAKRFAWRLRPSALAALHNPRTAEADAETLSNAEETFITALDESGQVYQLPASPNGTVHLRITTDDLVTPAVVAEDRNVNSDAEEESVSNSPSSERNEELDEEEGQEGNVPANATLSDCSGGDVNLAYIGTSSAEDVESLTRSVSGSNKSAEKGALVAVINGTAAATTEGGSLYSCDASSEQTLSTCGVTRKGIKGRRRKRQDDTTSIQSSSTTQASKPLTAKQRMRQRGTEFMKRWDEFNSPGKTLALTNGEDGAMITTMFPSAFDHNSETQRRLRALDERIAQYEKLRTRNMSSGSTDASLSLCDNPHSRVDPIERSVVPSSSRSQASNTNTRKTTATTMATAHRALGNAYLKLQRERQRDLEKLRDINSQLENLYDADEEEQNCHRSSDDRGKTALSDNSSSSFVAGGSGEVKNSVMQSLLQRALEEEEDEREAAYGSGALVPPRQEEVEYVSVLQQMLRDALKRCGPPLANDEGK